MLAVEESAETERDAGAATLAKSTATVPPESVRLPVKRLSLAELRVSVPAPSFVIASLSSVVTGAAKTPLKVVLVSSRPTVSIVLTVLPEFLTVPAPASEPIVTA